MNRFSKIAFLAAACLAATGVPALADSADPPAGDDAAGGGGGAAPAGGASVGATAEAPVAGAWTQQIIDRPLTVKKSMIAPFVSLPIAKVTVLGASATGIGLQVGADYGVSDKLQVGAAYAFGLKDFEIKGTLQARVGFNLLDKEKMKAAITADAGYDINASAAAPIDLGVAFLYKVAPKFAIFTPGGQLPIGLDPDTSLSLNLPVGVMLQATPMINVQAQTSIAHIGISPSGGNAIFGADFVPLTIGAFYSPSNKMDFGLSFATDVKNSPGDAFIIGLVARLYNGGGI